MTLLLTSQKGGLEFVGPFHQPFLPWNLILPDFVPHVQGLPKVDPSVVQPAAVGAAACLGVPGLTWQVRATGLEAAPLPQGVGGGGGDGDGRQRLPAFPCSEGKGTGVGTKHPVSFLSLLP